MILTGAPTTILRGWVALCAVGAVESVAFTVKFDVPAVVGVPERTPAVLRERPAGSEPEITVHV